MTKPENPAPAIRDYVAPENTMPENTVPENAAPETLEVELVHAKSSVASEIDRLKRATCDITSRRERVPQPMFWSLFHDQLNALKERKRLERVIEAALGGYSPEE